MTATALASINNPRRFFLLKSRAASAAGDVGLAATWRAKQAGVDATALADDFPLRARLLAAGYSTLADLDGADADELREQGFTNAEARSVLAALED